MLPNYKSQLARKPNQKHKQVLELPFQRSFLKIFKVKIIICDSFIELISCNYMEKALYVNNAKDAIFRRIEHIMITHQPVYKFDTYSIW